MHTEPTGHPLGIHRVLHPPSVLPQPAERLDADVNKHFSSEIVVDVETLNIDAASFRQMEEASGGSAEGVARQILETVVRRGKQHNPVTGSGGMLLGRVQRVGAHAESRGFSVGDRVATLASLSLTPLSLSKIKAVRPVSAQVDVEGTAIVFLSAPLANLPIDMEERLALALLDVAGAAPQVARLLHEGDTALVLGAGGKSGILCCAEARRRVGKMGRVIAFEASDTFARDLERLHLCDEVKVVDCRSAVEVHRISSELTQGRFADVTFSCVNVGGVELSAILGTRDRGKVYFFAMSTSFAAAALGAEGVGRDVDLYIGNGYAHGHAAHTLNLVRENPAILELLKARYG